MDLHTLRDSQLLALHCQVMALLRERGVVRSSNNPVGDYTEALVAKALGVELAANSQSGYDAIGADGTRYQIKGRRLTVHNGSTQLSAIRNMDGAPFDQLAAVIYDGDLAVQYAGLIPILIVKQVAKYRAHTNSHTLHFRRPLLDVAGVVNITDRIRASQAT